MDRFKPELMIISAGFDARHGDPLGRLELTDEDYVDLTGLVLEMARRHAAGPRRLDPGRRLQPDGPGQRGRRALRPIAASVNHPGWMTNSRPSSIGIATTDVSSCDRRAVVLF